MHIRGEASQLHKIKIPGVIQYLTVFSKIIFHYNNSGMVKYMKQNKNNLQKLKWFFSSLILCMVVFGMYITYQAQVDKKVEDKPTEAAQSEAKDNTLIEEDLNEDNTIENTNIENIKKEDNEDNIEDSNDNEKEEVITEKSTVRESKDLASRGTDITAKQEQIPVMEKAEKTSSSEEKTDTLKSQASENDTALNSYVLNVIKTYNGGNYPYLLNNDYANYNGVTENLYYMDKVLLKANPSGDKASFCSGITFEVFFKAMQNRNKDLNLSSDAFNGMSYDQLYDFILTWYVANGDKKTNNVSIAVEKYGIGKSVTNLENAKAGDFMDISREDNTGHTVVFLNWLRDNNGRIIGVRYWSSQESTNGISEKEEYFNVRDSNGKKYGNVMINMVYIARVL